MLARNVAAPDVVVASNGACQVEKHILQKKETSPRARAALLVSYNKQSLCQLTMACRTGVIE